MAKRNILVIEDDKEMTELITQVLTKEGYFVDIAYDGEDGFNKLKSTRPDMVILDIMLPKLDGRDLLKKAKQDEHIKNIPILIISARTEQWDRDLGLELGAEEYIEKPLEVVKLLRQVRNILSNKE